MSFRALRSPLLASLLLASAAPFPATAEIGLPPFPDACVSALTPGRIVKTPLAGSAATLYMTSGSADGKRLVLLINGNCYGSTGYYDDLAGHLASNGFATALLIRPGNSQNLTDVFTAIDAALAQLGWDLDDPALKIALVGHSVGGKVAIEAAAFNAVSGSAYPVRALATLAPVASTGTWVDGAEAPAYLTLYGSQDDDVDAYDGVADEAFFTYDNAGTESSTTCTTPPCISPVIPFQKTMAFVYGADHAGMIGVPALPGSCGLFSEQTLDYLSASDTLCITKAYLTGFLRYHLYGESAYKGMLRGDWKPASVAAITTAEADGYGNPAGRPLRLFLQNSPVQHQTIQAFTSSLGATANSAGVALQHEAVGGLSGTPFYLRHHTGTAAVGWNAVDTDQWARFTVPSGVRNGSTFTHFSLRIGQLNGAPSPYHNTANADVDVWLGFRDGNGAESWHLLSDVPTPDRYTGSGVLRAQSHLTTRRISVASITGIDKTDIRYIYLYFEAPSHGTVLVDSFEWDRD